MVYLIGGAVRTGKSKLANKILLQKQISVISTDAIIGLVKDFVKKDFSDPRPNFIQKAENFYPTLKELIRLNLVLGNRDFVYEGDIILPEQAMMLSKEFDVRSCFLGFSQIDIDKLQEHIGDHKWLHELSKEELQALPDKIIEVSQYIEAECKKYNLAYFGLSKDFYTEQDRAYRSLTGF